MHVERERDVHTSMYMQPDTKPRGRIGIWLQNVGGTNDDKQGWRAIAPRMQMTESGKEEKENDVVIPAFVIDDDDGNDNGDGHDDDNDDDGTIIRWKEKEMIQWYYNNDTIKVQ